MAQEAPDCRDFLTQIHGGNSLPHGERAAGVGSPVHPGKALADAGYVPLVATGKGVYRPEWQIDDADVLRNEARNAAPTRNFGVRCGDPVDEGFGIVALDFDLDDEPTAAKLTEVFVRSGYPVRHGRPGRLLTVVRAPLGTRNNDISFVKHEGVKGKVQLLAYHKQFIAYGIHPETRKPYTWLGKSIVEVPPASLPEVPDAGAFVMAVMQRVGWKTPDKPSQNAPPAVKGGSTFGDDAVAVNSDIAPLHEPMDETPENIERVRSALAAVPAGCDYDEGWFSVGFAVLSTGWKCAVDLLREWSQSAPERYDEAAFNKLVASYRDRDDGITIGTLFDLAKKSGWIDPRRAVAVSTDTGDVATLERSGNGKVPGTYPNVYRACLASSTIGMRIAYDEFGDVLMLSRDGGRNWEPFCDQHYVDLQMRLADIGFGRVARDVLRDVVYKVGIDNKFDSARLWLDSLPPWDGISRIDTFAARYLGAEDTPYTRTVGRYWWTALAGRVLDRGCKADMVPVLVGPQGARKSSTIAAIPPDRAQFAELSLDERDADASRKIRGRLVIEFSELRGLSLRDSESLKAFIVQQDEVWTPKFKEFTQRYPRRCVFVGSTNSEQFLSDKTGERRWLPIRVGECRPDDVARDREQLWAEAAMRFRANGVEWQDAERLAGVEHERYKMPDVWEERIEGWLNTPSPISKERPGDKPFRMEEVFAALGIDCSRINRGAENRVGSILRALGYDRKREMRGGVRAYFWSRGA